MFHLDYFLSPFPSQVSFFSRKWILYLIHYISIIFIFSRLISFWTSVAISYALSFRMVAIASESCTFVFFHRNVLFQRQRKGSASGNNQRSTVGDIQWQSASSPSLASIAAKEKEREKERDKEEGTNTNSNIVTTNPLKNSNAESSEDEAQRSTELHLSDSEEVDYHSPFFSLSSPFPLVSSFCSPQLSRVLFCYLQWSSSYISSCPWGLWPLYLNLMSMRALFPHPISGIPCGWSYLPLRTDTLTCRIRCFSEEQMMPQRTTRRHLRCPSNPYQSLKGPPPPSRPPPLPRLVSRTTRRLNIVTTIAAAPPTAANTIRSTMIRYTLIIVAS